LWLPSAAAYGPPHPTEEDAVPNEQNPVVASGDAEEAVVEETLVEEVSIDGMCGVY
jgi:mycofactocin precursor